MKDVVEQKNQLQAVMRKIVTRLQKRTKNEVFAQSVEAMREDLWYCQIEIEEALNDR